LGPPDFSISTAAAASAASHITPSCHHNDPASSLATNWPMPSATSRIPNRRARNTASGSVLVSPKIFAVSSGAANAPTPIAIRIAGSCCFGFMALTLLTDGALDQGREPFAHRVCLLIGGRLDHHADQRLGARRPNEHAPAALEL